MNLPDPDKAQAAVLLPLNDSAQSAAAIPVAQRIAALADAMLHIVYISDPPLAPEALRDKLRLSHEQLAGAVLEGVAGEPSEAVVALARTRSSLLIVMAMHSGHPRPESGLGGVSEEVLRHAPCPVLFVPPDRVPADWQMEKVLLPQDGTPGTAAALEPMVHLSHHGGATLFVLHVAGPWMGRREPGALSVPRYVDQPQHEWPAFSGEFLDRVRGLCHIPEGFELRFFLGRGEAGAEILRVAGQQGVDLIVLPWHGSLEPHHAMTLKAVLREAPCPVLILPFGWPALKTAE